MLLCDLPQPILTRIFSLVVEKEPLDILKLIRLNKQCHELVDTNVVWFHAYQSHYYPLNTGLNYQGGPSPVKIDLIPNWKDKFKAVKTCQGKWSALAEQQAPFQQWTDIVTVQDVLEYLENIGLDDYTDLQFTNIVADRWCELEKCPLIGISTIANSFPADPVASIFIYNLETKKFIKHLDFTDQTFPVLQYMDHKRNLVCLVYENVENNDVIGDWTRIGVYNMDTLTERASIELNALWLGQRLCPFQGKDSLVILGWTRMKQGLMVEFNENSGQILQVRQQGVHVRAISEGDPYYPYTFITSHENGELCIWDLSTGAILHPDDRMQNGAWKRPNRPLLISMAAKNDLIESIAWNIPLPSNQCVKLRPTSRHYLQFPGGNEIATCYLIFPFFYSNSFSGLFTVYNIITLSCLFKMERLDFDLEEADYIFYNIVRPGNDLLLFTPKGITRINV